MENLENNIIQQKINSLDTLPEGYAPSMENKWELIETALDGKNRKKPLFWYWSAAAVVLFTVGMWWVNLRPSTNQNSNLIKPTVVAPEKITTTPVAPLVVKANTPEKIAPKGLTRKNKTSEPKAIAQQLITQQDTQVIPENILPEPETSPVKLATITPKRTKAKILEFDFNDVPAPSSNMAANGITHPWLKIGIGSVAKTEKSENKTPGFKFKATF